MKKMTAFLAVLFIVFFAAHVVKAEQIDDFDVKIQVNKNGIISIQEKIVYDFGNEYKHGIYRDIPYIKTNQDGKKYQMDLTRILVTDETGGAYPFSKIREDRQIRLKIGDARRTVTGVHTYQINYQVSGALTYFSDHDELYWNITGNDWVVPIVKASSKIQLPAAVPQKDINAICYTGTVGSKDQHCTVDIQNNNVFINSSRPLPPSAGMTSAVGFPKNIVAVIEPKPVIDFFDTLWGKFFIIVVGLLILLWYVLYPIWLPIKWYLYGRDPKVAVGEVTAAYDPPKSQSGHIFTPAETGTIIDESVDMRDIVATVVDLARRGFLKIVEKKKNDFYLVKQNEFKVDRSLQQFEKDLLTGIFSDGDEIRIKDQDLYETVESVKKTIYRSMISQGSFPEDPQKKRTFYMIVVGLAVVTMNLPLVLLSLIFGRVMFRKTVLGKKQANVAKSLYNFLTTQSRQLEFQARGQMFFEKLLPYAVAFGVERLWAKRFAGLKIAPPTWYQSYDNRTFTTIYFISSLNSSLNSFSSVARPPTSTTSTSGFSSGFSGGSSGGGGGGGGGGSW